MQQLNIESRVGLLLEKEKIANLHKRLGEKVLEADDSVEARRLELETKYNRIWQTYSRLIGAIGHQKDPYSKTHVKSNSLFMPIVLANANSDDSGGGGIQTVLTPFNSRNYFNPFQSSTGEYYVSEADSCLVSTYYLKGKQEFTGQPQGVLINEEWFTSATSTSHHVGHNSQQYIKTKREMETKPYTAVELVAAEAAVEYMVNQGHETLSLLIPAASNLDLNPLIAPQVQLAFNRQTID